MSGVDESGLSPHLTTPVEAHTDTSYTSLSPSAGVSSAAAGPYSTILHTPGSAHSNTPASIPDEFS